MFDGAVMEAFDPQGSIVSGTIGAILGSNAQRQAADTAADAAKASQAATNAQNQSLFNQAHGSTGSAVFPQYLTGEGGAGLFEPELGQDLVKSYAAANVPLSTFQSATDKTAGARNQALDFTNSIFNGGVTNKMLTNVAPVQTQRLATARSSSLDALHKTLDQIDASQANRGYVGDSYGNRLLSFQAGKEAGNSIGAAQLQNKQETADIQNYGDVTLPLQNINLPYQMNQQQASAAFLPQDEYLASLGQRMQPFNMLKLGYTGPFQYQPLPTRGPAAFNSGATALSAFGGGAGQLGGAAMNYFGTNNLLSSGYGGSTIGNGASYGQLPSGFSDTLTEDNASDPFYASGAAAAGAGVANNGLDFSGSTASGVDSLTGGSSLFGGSV